MTTTTRSYAGFSITHTYSDGDVLSDGTPTAAALARLHESVAAAIRAELPGARVEVECRERTSGASSTLVRTPDGRHMEQEPVKELAHEAAGRAWQAWCESLTDADVESR